MKNYNKYSIRRSRMHENIQIALAMLAPIALMAMYWLRWVA